MQQSEYADQLHTESTQPTESDYPIKQPTVDEFFKQFTAYHIMPTSSRVLTIDADTSLYRAFRIIGDNAVSSAYVWNRQTQLYTSVLTATDIMKSSLIIYQNFFASDAPHDPVAFCQRNNIKYTEKPELIDFLQHISIQDCKHNAKLILSNTQTTLHEAIQKMMAKNVHRLPVIDNDGSIVLSLTYRNICRFLVSKFKFDSQVLQKLPLESGVANRDFLTASVGDTLYTVVSLIVKNRLSSIPIIDTDGRLYDVFSKYDFSALASIGGKIDLDQPVKDVVDRRPSFLEGCVTMPVNSTIGQILRQIADKNLHRMMLTDENDDKKLIAVVSLRHVLKYLCEFDVYDVQPDWNGDATHHIKHEGSDRKSIDEHEHGNNDGLIEDAYDENNKTTVNPGEFQFHDAYLGK